jgi:hypothetical protein
LAPAAASRGSGAEGELPRSGPECADEQDGIQLGEGVPLCSILGPGRGFGGGRASRAKEPPLSRSPAFVRCLKAATPSVYPSRRKTTSPWTVNSSRKTDLVRRAAPPRRIALARADFLSSAAPLRRGTGSGDRALFHSLVIFEEREDFRPLPNGRLVTVPLLGRFLNGLAAGGECENTRDKSAAGEVGGELHRE